MEKELPEIPFDAKEDLHIEVMNFEELYHRLKNTENHDPFCPHQIEFYLILVVTKKGYTHFLDFQSYELGPGSTLFIAKNQVHHFNEGLGEAEGYGIVFSHLFVDRHYFLTDNVRLNRLFNYHIERPVLHRSELENDDLVGLFAHLHYEYGLSNTFAKSEILASMLRVLLLKAERAKEGRAVLHVNPYWLEIFSTFKDLLETEYVNTRSSRKYAEKLFVSYKFLNDVVKQLTGKTVKAFIDDFVTVEIKRNLISTALTVNEIAYRTGFQEPPNMIKFFKKNTGMTPLKFRQQL